MSNEITFTDEQIEKLKELVLKEKMNPNQVTTSFNFHFQSNYSYNTIVRKIRIHCDVAWDKKLHEYIAAPIRKHNKIEVHEGQISFYSEMNSLEGNNRIIQNDAMANNSKPSVTTEELATKQTSEEFVVNNEEDKNRIDITSSAQTGNSSAFDWHNISDIKDLSPLLQNHLQTQDKNISELKKEIKKLETLVFRKTGHPTFEDIHPLVNGFIKAYAQTKTRHKSVKINPEIKKMVLNYIYDVFNIKDESLAINIALMIALSWGKSIKN